MDGKVESSDKNDKTSVLVDVSERRTIYGQGLSLLEVTHIPKCACVSSMTVDLMWSRGVHNSPPPFNERLKLI